MSFERATLPTLVGTPARPSTAGMAPPSARLLQARGNFKGSASAITVALNRENDAKHVAATHMRALRNSATAGSRSLLLARRRDNVIAIRKEWDEQTGKDLAARLSDIEPASDEVVTKMAIQLNMAMARVWPESRSQSSYFKLFKLMDKDHSGLITLYELGRVTRELLRVALTEELLLAVWKWVDSDGNGTIKSGEFLKFVRKGWDAFVAEQERLSGKKPIDLLRRPNWVDVSQVPFDRPVWKEQTMTLAQRRKFYLDSAHGEVLDRTRKFKEMARRSEAEAVSWEERVAKVRPKTASSAGQRGMMAASASAPVLYR